MKNNRIAIEKRVQEIYEHEEKLNKKLIESEGMLTGLVLKNPEVLLDYSINRKNLSADGLFYIGIVDRLLEKGVESVNAVAFMQEVEALGLMSMFQKKKGYEEVEKLMAVVDLKNTEVILDEYYKWQLVKDYYYEKGILDIVKHWSKLLQMRASQVVDYVEYQVTSTDLDVCTDLVYEKLSYTDKEIQDLQDGINMGLKYNKYSPLLNYLTLGIAKSEVYLFGGYTNSGKSSFIFQNMIIPIIENGHKCCVISNEQKSSAFKVLLQVYVLTTRLNYWKLDRKRIRMGKFTEEDLRMMKEARELIKREYDPYLTFVKVFDYNTNKVGKIVKKLSKTGYECFFYDTFKVSENGDGATWEKLLKDSKDLFQIASKFSIALILSVQLALHTKNKTRFLDEGVLSNGKQMAETIETGVYMRDIWEDEWEGETYDIKPYVFQKDSKGKYTKNRIELVLDKTKRYKLMFLSKTRSDENGQVILYEFNGAYNKWNEIGRCTPHTKNSF